MEKSQKIFLACMFIISLTACNVAGSPPEATATIDMGLVGTVAAMTLEAMYSPTLAPTATPVLTATPAATSTPNVTATVTPTVTPTYSQPLAKFDGDTNCRQGPGTEYEVVTVVHNGQKVEIVGKAEIGNYWVVKIPQGEGTCWVAGDYAQTSGSLHLLPTMTAPPTPTPVPPHAPSWKSWNYSCAIASGGSDVTVELVWSDILDEEGYNVYRNDALIATFGPDITTYTDVAFVAYGQSVSYVIEAFNAAGRVRNSAVTVVCQ